MTKAKNTKAKLQIKKDDVVYALYLDTKEYKQLLENNEYIVKDNGDVLLGLYKNINFAEQHKAKFNKRGLLVNLVTE